MSDRRRTSRFIIPDSSQGTFRVMQDVCVEQVNGDLFVVVSEVPLQIGEELTLEPPRALGMRSVVHVEVVSSTGVWVGDSRRHRVVMRSTAPVDGRKLGPKQPEIVFLEAKPPLPALGVLIRRVPVRVRDVSTSGCLLETLDALIEGTVGQLEVVLDGETHSEPLRVCRSARSPGSPWPWRSGASFLALAAPPPASVRNVVARFEIMDELNARTVGR